MPHAALFNGYPHLFQPKFDAARTQILKDFLNKNGLSLDELEAARTQFQKDGTENEQYQHVYDLLKSFPELEGEFLAYLDRQNAPKPTEIEMPAIPAYLQKSIRKDESAAVRSLLSMKRDNLAEAGDEEPAFEMSMMEIRAGIYEHIVDEYYERTHFGTSALKHGKKPRDSSFLGFFRHKTAHNLPPLLLTFIHFDTLLCKLLCNF